jgi:hypothetical protein
VSRSQRRPGVQAQRSAAVLTYNQTFSLTTTTSLRPTSVLQARFIKLSAQIDF